MTALKLVFAALLLIGCRPAIAQHDSLWAESRLTLAVKAVESGREDSAVIYHQEALRQFEQLKRYDAWLLSWSKMAFAYADGRDLPYEAVAKIEQGIRQFPRQPANEKEWTILCKSHLNIGFFYHWYIADMRSAARAYESGFQIFTQQLNSHNDKIARFVFHQYGNVCTQLGDYERAIALLQGGIDYGVSQGISDIGQYGDLAIALLELNRPADALKVIEEGLADPYRAAKTRISLYNNAARAWLMVGRNDEARKALEQTPRWIDSLVVADPASDVHYYQSGYWQVLGGVLEQEGRPADALRAYAQALSEERRSEGGISQRSAGKIYRAMGDIYLQFNQIPEALSAFQQTLRSVLPHFQPRNVYELPPLALFFAENTLIEGLEGKARCFESMNRLDDALRCYDLITFVENQLRATHAYESSSLIALRESRDRFDRAVSIAWKRYDTSRDTQYLHIAFHFSELARGLLLMRSLAMAQFDYQLPPELRRREQYLSGRVAFIGRQIADAREAEADGALVNALLTEQNNWVLQRERFQRDTLAVQFPQYAVLTDSMHFVAAEDVKNLLRADQILLDYYLTPDAAFVFHFDARGGMSWRKTPLSAQFTAQIDSVRRFLSDFDESIEGKTQFLRLSEQWYRQLVAPDLVGLDHIEGLAIIPDGGLSLIPFEALTVRPHNGDQPWSEAAWLLNDYDMAYTYSASLLHRQQALTRGRQGVKRRNFAGFAPEFARHPAGDLPTSRAEVKSVKKLLGGDIFLGKNANERVFADTAEHYRVLLLSMHGIADETSPERSQLLFGDTQNGPPEQDNILYAGELQLMRLQADLAVMSACHTGDGKIQHGEGVYSLARALTIAGVPATVMSLWRLSPQSGPRLIGGFFRQIKQEAGITKDRALRLAKLAFLEKSDGYDHPYFWAGLAANGDMSPLALDPVEPSSLLPMLYLGLLILASVFVWYWIKRRRAD